MVTLFGIIFHCSVEVMHVGKVYPVKPGYESSEVKARSDIEIKSEEKIKSPMAKQTLRTSSVLLVGEVC